MTKIKQIKEQSAHKSLIQMRTLYKKVSEQYASFFKTKADPDESISINRPRYGALDTSVSELVQHVVNHGIYHCGNITAMLRQQGHPGVPTDYVFYLYDVA